MCSGFPTVVTDPVEINKYRDQYNARHESIINDLKARGENLAEHGYADWRPLEHVPLDPANQSKETLETPAEGDGRRKAQPSPWGTGGRDLSQLPDGYTTVPGPGGRPDQTYEHGDDSLGGMGFTWPAAPAVPTPPSVRTALTSGMKGNEGMSRTAKGSYTGGGRRAKQRKSKLRSDFSVNAGSKSRAGLQIPG